MKLKLIAALSIANAATLPFAAIANACGGGGDLPADYEFATPSRNIVCNMYADNSGANCEVREHTWVAPASTSGPHGRACDFSFGGQTYSRGAMTCDSELSGVTCTDTGTGHFFRVSRENYELG